MHCHQWLILRVIGLLSRQEIILGDFLRVKLLRLGKVPPAKVLVIGAGVAGLAAIGTAQSMGAIVRAFDVRPEVSEQIELWEQSFYFLILRKMPLERVATLHHRVRSFERSSSSASGGKQSEVDIVITTALIPGGMHQSYG